MGRSFNCESLDCQQDLLDYWTSPKVVLKCVGPKLVPFFKTVAVYFVLAIPGDNPSWFACLIKCLPVGWLCIFVVLHGISLGEKHAYSRKVLAGLIFSCLGDLLLIWPCCFIWGMLCFAVALLLYTLAFGMSPLNPLAGLVCLLLGTVGNYFMYHGMNGAYAVLVPLYIYLLMIMVWRAVARVQLFEDLWTWTKLCSCGGGILFAISDTLIGITMFYMPIPYAGNVIMIAYYAGQLGIALSVVDSSAIAAVSLAHSSNDQRNCCRAQGNAVKHLNGIPLKQKHKESIDFQDIENKCLINTNAMEKFE